MEIDFLKKEEFDHFFNGANLSSNFQNIQGSKSFQINGGKSVFSPYKIFATPEKEAFLKVTSPVITMYYNLFKNLYQISDFEYFGDYYLVFSLYFRGCVIGEIFLFQINR